MKKAETKKNQPEKKSTSTSKMELMKELNEKRLSLRDIRFNIAGSKSKNVKEQKMIKKQIARIHTKLGMIDKV
jgi:ribosomal protein L29